MKRPWCVATLAILLAGITTSDLLACGDKFLVPSRGVRFELTPSTRAQARVLMYLHPASSLSGLSSKLSLEPALRKAGYRATVAASAAEIDTMLRQDTWDVVLLDAIDGPVAGQPSGAPVMIAVAMNQKDRDLARARKQFATVLKSPSRSQAFVDALDQAVKTRRNDQAKAPNNQK